MASSDRLNLALRMENHRSQRPYRSAVGQGMANLIALLMLWRRRSEGRSAIRSMSSEQLRDLDLDVPALRREAEKPFWRA